METDHINRVAHEILAVLKSSATLLMSWGAVGFQASLYKAMPALKFPVCGSLFTGTVVVALNQSSDYYEVYCIDDAENVINSREAICFDELSEAIDNMVEKNCSQQEYNARINEWFSQRI